MQRTLEASTRTPHRGRRLAVLGLVATIALAAAACDVPDKPAGSLYDAWKANDRPAAAAVATPTAVNQLFAKPYAGTSGWFFSTCDGAAGSTYCTWIDNTEGRLQIRDDNATKKAVDVQRIGLGNIHAGRFFHAYRAGKRSSAAPYGSTTAIDQLFAVPYNGNTGHWTPVGCEGAAGSTYCTWHDDADERIILRVDNATDQVTSVQHVV